MYKKKNLLNFVRMDDSFTVNVKDEIFIWNIYSNIIVQQIVR